MPRVSRDRRRRSQRDRGPSPTFISPVPKAPTLGTIFVDWAPRLSAADDTAKPYVYDLDEHSLGAIPKNQHYVASAANLATEHETLDYAGAVVQCPVPFHPWGGPLTFGCTGFQTPGNVDDFVTAESDTTSLVQRCLGVRHPDCPRSRDLHPRRAVSERQVGELHAG